MSIEHPWFSKRFDETDYAIVGLLRQGFRLGDSYRVQHFEPVLLHPRGTYWETEQNSRCGCSGTHNGVEFSIVQFKTARWAFLERVYAEALSAAEQRYPDLYNIRWVSCLPNWRELVLPDCHSEAADFIEAGIEKIIRRGDIRIQTGVNIITEPIDPRYPWSATMGEAKRTRICLIVDEERLNKELQGSVYERCHAGKPIEVPAKSCLFTPRDLSEFIFRPSRFHIELLNYWEAKPIATEDEERMVDAVEKLNLDEADRLIDNGANVNAINKDAQTALTALTETFGPVSESDRIAAVQRLLNRGADVNLFSYEETDALINATLAAEPVTVEFLLNAGADPNHCPYPEEDTNYISLALFYATNDAFLDRGTPRGEACAKIEALLEGAGAKLTRNS